MNDRDRTFASLAIWIAASIMFATVLLASIYEDVSAIRNIMELGSVEAAE